MALTIELPYDLESQLREQAQEKGKALNQYIAGIIREKMNPLKPKATSLSAEETRLFQIINKGFSQEFWLKLHGLNQKRQEESLSEEELSQLIEMTDSLEADNVERMKALIALAHLRQTDLDTLMTQLGLNNSKHTKENASFNSRKS